MDEIDLLEVRWRLSPNVVDFKNLREACLASGADERLTKIELEYLAPYLEDFSNKYFEWDRFNSTLPKAIVDAAVEALLLQSQSLDLSPSHHYYRQSWDSINYHIRSLGAIHKAIRVEAWRDDDSYFGNAVFNTFKDAEKFRLALIRHHGYFGEDTEVRRTADRIDGPTLYKLEWHVGK